jgi:hypothetical protein
MVSSVHSELEAVSVLTSRRIRSSWPVLVPIVNPKGFGALASLKVFHVFGIQYLLLDSIFHSISFFLVVVVFLADT